MTLKLHCGTCADFLEFGTHVAVFFVLRGTSGLQFGTPGRHFGTRRAPFLCLFNTLERGPESCKHFRGKASIACGEHPAAGGLHVFSGTLGFNLLP